MTSTVESVTAYLTPPEHYFWQWRDRGEVASWASGATIAFRPELIGILEELAPTGLPPLGAVLLAMAACRDNWPQQTLELGALHGLNRVITHLDLQGTRLPDSLLGDTLKSLDALNRAPSKLRTDPTHKAGLIALIFEGVPRRIQAENAAAVLRLLREGYCPADEPGEAVTQRMRAGATFQTDLRALHTALGRMDLRDLEFRLRTGLDTPPEPTPDEAPPVADLATLVEQWQTDEHLGPTARIAQHLMALSFLPRRLVEPEHSSVGGVSDVTNRGSLDRLLVSELAHDDLTLAVRVALNEALYLRRESPPQSPMTTRALLLDSGIRLWGTPRLFAAATALAFGATLDRRSTLDVMRAAGSELERVNLSSHEGVADHLEVLRTEPHPGATLPAWQAHLKQQERADALLVTHADALRDPQFQQELSAFAESQALHVASVDASGEFALYQYRGRGRKLIRQATLDLEKLMRPPPANATGARRSKPRIRSLLQPYPAGMVLQPLPVRLPILPQSTKVAARTPSSHLVVVDATGHIAIWDRADRGANVLARIPEARNIHAVSVDGEDVVHIVHGRSSLGFRLHQYDIKSGRDFSLDLPFTEGENLLQALFYEQWALLLTESALLVFNRDDGASVGSIDLRSVHHPNSPLVHVQGSLFRIVSKASIRYFLFQYDGFTFSLNHLNLAEVERTYNIPASEHLLVFEHHGSGLRALTEDLRLIHLSPDRSDFLDTRTFRLYDGIERLQHVPTSTLPGSPRLANRRVGTDFSVSPDGNILRCRVSYMAETVDQDPRVLDTLIDLDHLTYVRHHDARAEELALYLLPPRHANAGEALKLSLVRPYQNLRYHFNALLACPSGQLGLRTVKGRNEWIDVDTRHNRCILNPREDTPDAVLCPLRLVEPPDLAFPNLLVADLPNGGVAYLEQRGLLHLSHPADDVPDVTLVLHHKLLAAWVSDGRAFGHRFFIDDLPRLDASLLRDLLASFAEPAATRRAGGHGS